MRLLKNKREVRDEQNATVLMAGDKESVQEIKAGG